VNALSGCVIDPEKREDRRERHDQPAIAQHLNHFEASSQITPGALPSLYATSRCLKTPRMPCKTPSVAYKQSAVRERSQLFYLAHQHVTTRGMKLRQHLRHRNGVARSESGKRRRHIRNN